MADTKEQSQSEAIENTSESADPATENTWIDPSEADNLTNTWVDEEDKGELSNTWAEDAFSDELSRSGASNSWVDADGETIYKKTEVPPEFVGGKDALFKYIPAIAGADYSDHRPDGADRRVFPGCGWHPPQSGIWAWRSPPAD